MSKKDQIFCISDLHLSAEHPEIFMAFCSFIEEKVYFAQSLYILGDFFNLWIGDDNPDEFATQAANVLANLAETGTQIFIMHGNRDFLLGPDFCSSCKATLINEPFILECFKSSYLLMHGDSLCTQDTDYIEFRNMVRNLTWQNEFLSKSIQERQAYADKVRKQSKSLSSNKPEDIMDVTPEEVISLMNSFDQEILVHGHTHRPAIHDVKLKDKTGSRIVLGDWNTSGWYLEITPKGHELVCFNI